MFKLSLKQFVNQYPGTAGAIFGTVVGLLILLAVINASP